MTDRDDMVIRLRLGPRQRPTARARSRSDRALAIGSRGGGVLRRMVQLRLARAAARAAETAIAGPMRLGAIRAAGGRLAFAPVGAVVAGLIIGAVAALRLASGQPFEGMGEQVNRMLLGDLDEDARAKLRTRQQLGADAQLLENVGRKDRIDSQIRTVAAELYRQNLREEIGAKKWREVYALNNTLDLLILRARDVFLAAWRGNGGADTYEQFRQRYRETRGEARGR